MTKTWDGIKSEVINLGFEKVKSFEKNKTAFIESFNWAQNFMVSTLCPLQDSVVIVKQKSDDVYVKYDIPQLTKKGEEEVFLSLRSQMPILKTQDKYKPITDFIVEKGRYILLKGEYEGEIEIFYNRHPLPITMDTKGDYPLEIEYQYANLLPYLMANRLWIDDDAAKAVHYWNLYDDMKNQIIQKNITINVVNDRWVI